MGKLPRLFGEVRLKKRDLYSELTSVPHLKPRRPGLLSDQAASSMSTELSTRNGEEAMDPYGQGFPLDVSQDEILCVLHAGLYSVAVDMRRMKTIMCQFMHLVMAGANVQERLPQPRYWLRDNCSLVEMEQVIRQLQMPQPKDERNLSGEPTGSAAPGPAGPSGT